MLAGGADPTGPLSEPKLRALLPNRLRLVRGLLRPGQALRPGPLIDCAVALGVSARLALRQCFRFFSHHFDMAIGFFFRLWVCFGSVPQLGHVGSRLSEWVLRCDGLFLFSRVSVSLTP